MTDSAQNRGGEIPIARALISVSDKDGLSELGRFLVDHQQPWREAVALAASHGVPTLAMGASLSYFDSYRRAQLPQNLTQAQRDYFGAHTYQRVDKPGTFHTRWSGDRSESEV